MTQRTLYDIRDTLEELCSDEDPIYHNDRETTINILVNSRNFFINDPIGYTSEDGFVDQGTLDGMIRDRVSLLSSRGYNLDHIDVNNSYDDIVKNIVVPRHTSV